MAFPIISLVIIFVGLIGVSLGLYLVGIIPSFWMVVGSAIFLGAMALVTYFLTRVPPKKKTESIHEDALNFGIGWLKRNFFIEQGAHVNKLSYKENLLSSRARSFR